MTRTAGRPVGLGVPLSRLRAAPVSIARLVFRAKVSKATLVLVGVPVVLNLWLLRAQRLPVQNSNDGAFHVAIIREAQRLLSAGHTPFDGWFSGLTTGFPVFHHYQTLPHAISGFLATLFGAERTYSWSLYLLLASWPIAVYLGGRLMGWDRWQAGIAAFLSPLIVALALTRIDGRPAGTYGYEWRSYTWGGQAGVWTQLWSMWLLPLAWGLTWRAVARRGSSLIACLAASLTLASHFITGYLALASIGAWVVVKPSEFVERLKKAVVVLACSLLATLWVIVPVLQDNKWSSQTRHLDGWYRNGYGAGRTISWFMTGSLFDEHRFPLITVLVGIGVLVCVKTSKRDDRARALLVIWGLSLALVMGRTMVGPLLKLVPGGEELLLSRMVVGVHLAGLYLAGIGATALATFFQLIRKRANEPPSRFEFHGPGRSVVVPSRVLGAVALAVLFVPSLSGAWADRARMANRESLLIHGQEVFDKSDGKAFADLVEFAKHRGPGRIYAGTCGAADPFVHCSDVAWGWSYKTFTVQEYISILNAGGEVIGYPLRTGSILTDVEVRFNERNVAQYDLYNIRYLIVPDDRAPRIKAKFLRAEGRHRLWEVKTTGYMKVVDIQGSIKADREDIGEAMEPFLKSRDLVNGIHAAVALEGRPAHEQTLLRRADDYGPAGRVLTERPDAKNGFFSAEVKARRTAAVMLKASFHGRWRAEVDGRRRRPFLVAPGYVAVTVAPGEHVVSFRYESYPHYGLLLGIGLLTLLGLSLPSLRRWRKRGRALRTSKVKSG